MPYKFASVWKPTTERPSQEFIDGVMKDGKSRLLDRFRSVLPMPLAVYYYGWFGDIWHLHWIAPVLQDKDPETRRVAVFAFSRLSGVHFENAESARAWWEQNKDSIPFPHEGKTPSK